MQHNFMLFSELQKKVSPSPIKTYRLLMRMRDDQRMKEGEDWMMVDRKVYVNVPRFIVELEQMGYAVKSDDFKTDDVKSDEIKKLAEEVRLTSSEIMESKIQEEMKSSDIKNTLPTVGMKSDEIKPEESTRKSDGISQTMISPEINLKSPEFNMLLRGKDEIIESKKEQIEHMKAMYTEILESKDKMLTSKDDELKEVRTALGTVVKQNETLVHQNVFLTRLLTGPKEARTQQHDDVISPDFRDVTEATPTQDGRVHEPEPVPTAAHDAPNATEGAPQAPQTTPDTHLASDHLDVNLPTPEDPVAQA